LAPFGCKPLPSLLTVAQLLDPAKEFRAMALTASTPEVRQFLEERRATRHWGRDGQGITYFTSPYDRTRPAAFTAFVVTVAESSGDPDCPQGRLNLRDVRQR
jgi:hypothetical protein